MAGLQEEPGVNVGLVVACTLVIVFTMLGVWLLSVHIAHGRPNGPLAKPVTPAGIPPDFGVLEQKQFTESSPRIEMAEHEHALLHGYGWNDAAHRSARVPIWRAEQLLLAKKGGADAGR